MFYVWNIGLDNIRFEAKDAQYLSTLDEFDFITTFDVIHDLSKPVEVLKSIYQGDFIFFSFLKLIFFKLFFFFKKKKQHRSFKTIRNLLNDGTKS